MVRTRKKRVLGQEALSELEILRQLLDPAVYQDFKARAREWSLLKRLRKKYEPIAFWRRIRPAIPLDSLTYFYGFGAEALHEEWTQYITFLATQRVEEARELDRNIEELERLLVAQDPNKDLDTSAKSQTIEQLTKKKIGLLEWADQ